MSEPKKHARFAASSSDRWMNCPSSIKLYEWALEQPNMKLIQIESAAATEGTTAHELMEFALNTGTKNVVESFESEGHKYPLEMRKHIQTFVDMVREETKPHFDLLVEERIELDFLHPTDAFGTVDVAIVEPFGALHVVDLKYGSKFVKEKDNSQMMYYALGIAHKFEYDFDEIKTTIFQPRTYGNPLRTFSFSVDHLLKWREKFEAAVKRVEKAKPKNDLCAGEWCHFCPAKLICPEITKNTFDKIKSKFDAPVQPDPKDLTSDQLKTILDRATYLELWIKEVKAYAQDEIKNGTKISGWELSSKKTTRKWKDHVNFFEGKWKHVKHYTDLKKFGVKFLTTDMMSPSEIEKEMKALKVPQDLIEKFFKDNVEFVPSEPTLSQSKNNYDGQDLGGLFVD